jgi:hypothetical protein
MTVPARAAHPLLDPNLTKDNPEVLRHLYKQYLEAKEGEEGYNAFLNQVLHPLGEKRPLPANLVTSAYYLNEAVSFLAEVLLMVPPPLRSSLSPLPEVMGCPDILELLTLIFASRDPRVSFEAQRKLYLTKLFFDVDHCWEVQRGDEHKENFESLLEQRLFSRTAARRPVEICYRIGPDGESIEYTKGPNGTGQECWTFDLRRLDFMHEGRPVHLNIYFYSCRFKREIIPFQYERGADHYQLAATEVWPGLSKKRSASIIAKMIRKGENDPRWIQDLIGAMFIVENLYEVETLKETLFDLFGGVFRVRDVTDTLTRPADRSRLNPWSGHGYEVYKATVDLLHRSERLHLPIPYMFSVEIQLYTLESYLRTIHSSHYANHRAMKRRQFLRGLVPCLFPEEIYGPEIARAVAEEAPGEAEGTVGQAR